MTAAHRTRRAVLVAAIVLAAVAALTVAPASAAPATAPAAVPSSAVDPVDSGGPLDLAEVVLEQRDVRMYLRITTRGDWESKELSRSGRTLCVTLVQGDPALARGRLCVPPGARRALDYTPLREDGMPFATRRLAAAISRPQRSVVETTFLPAAAGLVLGPYAWQAQSTWRDGTDCADTCTDTLPDAGLVAGELQLLGVPRCFGAASRDPERTCSDPGLRLSVTPSPANAGQILDSYCNTLRHTGLLTICEFGAAAEQAADSFVLVGDSHAASLKTPLEVLTLAKGWRGYSLLRAACPATKAARPVVGTRERSRQCVRWNREVLAWLGERDIDTVVLSTHVGADVEPSPGRSEAETAKAGYRDEIRALLRLVGRVVVIRDLPSSAPGHLRCVASAQRAGRPPGVACARPRARALRADPLVAAARSIGSSRVRVIDLTAHVCSSRRCLPVVGGALVHRDETHMTPAFAATLGPYILRALDG